jgi:hypothetical protein
MRIVTDLSEKMTHLQRALPSGYGSVAPASTRFLSLTDAPELAEDRSRDGPSAASPEDIAIERETETLLSMAAAMLRDVAATLPEAEHLYIEIALGGAEPLPAREMARLMRRPVEDIYKLKQRVLKRLKDALADQEAVKKWRTTVGA